MSSLAGVAILAACLALPAGAAPRDDDTSRMKSLDEQIQEVKSDVLAISEELSRLEEKLLFPSGTQVAVFVALEKGDAMRLDAVRLHIDGELVTHYIYAAKELEALRRGGVQRLYVGNVATGEHRIDVLIEGLRADGSEFSRSESFAFRKEIEPELVGLTFSDSDSDAPRIAFLEW